MKKLNPHIKEEIKNAKRIFKLVCEEYKLPIIPLEFKNLDDCGGSGYLESITQKSTKKIIKFNKIVIGAGYDMCYDPDYVMCHELAHYILGKEKNYLGHDKRHKALTYKLARKFNLC